MCLFLAALTFTSCINSDESFDAQLQRDREAIADYIEQNQLVNVKQIEDSLSGVVVIWQEVSDSGIKPYAGDTLEVDYIGRLLNNVVFDTSSEQIAQDNDIFDEDRDYIPLKFPIGRNVLIEGFELGVAQMEQGDRATVFIPSLFAYGPSGTGGRVPIPPNSPIFFELDLIEVIEGAERE